MISLLWCALKVEASKDIYYSESYYPLMLACEKQWRSFLNEGYVPFQFLETYMVVHPDQLIIPRLAGTQNYLMRNLDLTVVTNDRGGVYFYAKLPRFLFWTPLSSSHSSPANLIDMRGGHYDSSNIPTDPVINGFIS
jgi:hypothetical protein